MSLTDKNRDMHKTFQNSGVNIITTFIAILGVIILVVEAQNIIQNSFELYLLRLFSTVFAFVVLILNQTEFGKKRPAVFAHLVIFFVIVPSLVVSYMVPAYFKINILIIGFFILAAGIFITWNWINLFIVFLYTVSGVIAVNFMIGKSFNFDKNQYYELGLLVLFSIIAFISNLFIKKILSKMSGQDPVNSNQPVNTNELFKSMFEHSADGMFQISEKGKFALVNDSFAKILGYDSIDEVYKINNYQDLFKNPEEFEQFTKLIQRQNRVKNYRVVFARKDEAELIIRLNCRAINNEKNELSILEGSIQDITHLVRKEIESIRALKRLSEEKAKANNEIDEAKKTSDFKSQFLANMTHEIRTPMNSVLGFLTLIENDLYENKEELSDFAKNARQSAEALLDIINNILDISKIEAGKMELDDKEFNFREEIEKVTTMLTPAVKEKGLSLNFNISSEVPELLTGDATRYRQVLVNLLSNAIKFTDTGVIVVEVNLLPGKFRKLRTIVKDTGRGIPENKIATLFRPYMQLKEKNKDKTQGTGLGLVICREFVKLMGGEIEVKSTIGVGTTFGFTVSFQFEGNESALEEIDVKDENKDEKEIAEIDAEPVSSNSFPRIPASQRTKKRILLVEDNPISQKVELRILREVGYAVDPVSNGIDAIEAIKTGNFDLVLMDVEMAEMDGITATKKIREMDSDSNKIPIIAVTANSSMKDREKCLAAGMDDYIAKPININFLKMTIDRWLNEVR